MFEISFGETALTLEKGLAREILLENHLARAVLLENSLASVNLPKYRFTSVFLTEFDFARENLLEFDLASAFFLAKPNSDRTTSPNDKPADPGSRNAKPADATLAKRFFGRNGLSKSNSDRTTLAKR